MSRLWISRFLLQPPSAMFQWRVIILSALAVALILGGLAVLILPDSYEGPDLYQFDEQHTLRSFDMLGVVLLVVGCLLTWSAGILWQRQMDAS